VSFDIVIATRTRPTRAMVESHLLESGWRLTLEGDLAADKGNLAAESRGLLRHKHIFILSGPDPAEHEDLPYPVQQVLRGRAFLLEMNLPWGLDEKDMSRAFALCEHLARECGGAVFDPQEDRLRYPVVPDKPARREPVLTPIRQLTLEWYLPSSDAKDGSRFLETARRIWPEAAPTRFGQYEPLRSKLADPDGEVAFLDQWQPETSSFFWKAKKPVFGGSIFWSPEVEPPDGAEPKVTLSLDVSATAIETDPLMCDRAVELFVAVAEELRAFFGAGYVTRGVLTGSRGAQWYGQGTEKFSDDWISGRWWLGLPTKPTWLAWYGEPYRDLVAASMDGPSATRERGLLVRLGPTPMDTDQLRGIAPDLPTELLVKVETKQGVGPMRGITEYERTPASHIPSFD
jgi:hypothetical protein